MRRYSVALVSVLALAACGGNPLAERDPNGYQACALLADSMKSTDVANKLNKSMEAGEYAMRSSTESIQDSASALFDEGAMQALEDTDSAGQNFAMTDVKKLTAACEAEGFSIPKPE